MGRSLCDIEPTGCFWPMKIAFSASDAQVLKIALTALRYDDDRQKLSIIATKAERFGKRGSEQTT